jgi:Holliday junction resolvase RusA-like endonuclease
MFDKVIKFTVFGEPQSKLRAKARINRKSGTVYMYTPETTRNYEEGFAGQSLKSKPDSLILGPIKIMVSIYRSPQNLYLEKIENF